MKIDWMADNNRKKEETIVKPIIETPIKPKKNYLKIFSIFLIIGIFVSLFFGIFYLINRDNTIKSESPSYPQLIQTERGLIEKNYLASEQTITLTDSVTKQTNEIKLNTPINNRVGLGYQMVAELEFNTYDDFKTYLVNNNFQLIDLNNNKDTTRKLDFKYKTIEQVLVNDYDYQCEKGDIEPQKCTSIIIGNHYESREIWENLNEYAFKSTEPVTVGIFTDVKRGDNIEWIPTLYGVKITEWAVWTADLEVGLKAWYDLNGNASDYYGVYNGLNDGGDWVNNGKIDGAVSFVSGNTDFILFNSSTAVWRGDTSWSVSFWFNGTDSASYEGYIGDWNATSNKRSLTIRKSDTNNIEFYVDADGAAGGEVGATIQPAAGWDENKWYHVVIVQNTTHIITYFNGTQTSVTAFASAPYSTITTNWTAGYSLFSAEYANVRMDLIGLFNRTLNSTEVSDLFNSGAGLNPSGETSTININLISPANNTGYVNLTQKVNFTSFVNITGIISVQNVTIEIQHSNGTLMFTETNTTGQVGNYSFSNDFSAGTYNWTVYAFGNDSIRYNSTNGTFYFTVQPFEVTGESFNNFTLETDSETFYVNISTINDILSTSIKLNYNGTPYFTETNCVSGFCELMQTIDIPLVSSGDNENKTFFWELTLFGLSGDVFKFNTTSHQQNVSRLYLNMTNTLKGNTTLNFTTWTETNRTTLTPMSFKATFNTWLGSGTIKRTNSFQNTSANSGILLDISRNRTFYTDAFIEYNAVGVYNGTYTTRNYHFQNASLVNQTGIQNIRLFLLETSSSTSFIQRVVDTSQLAQVGVLIFQQRYYPETDEFETVSITKTDNSGEAVGFYQTEVPDYRHIITSDGTLLKTTERGKIFPQTSPYTLIFTIGDTFETAWESFENISNIVSSLTYNETTGIITYQWIDSTGALTWANLTVDKSYSNQSNVNYCDKSSQLTAGILTCNVSGQSGTFVAKGYIGRSPSVLDKLITFTISTIKEVLATPFLFLWIIFLIGALGISLAYPPAGIILTSAILILGVVLGITGIGWIFVFSIIAVGVWVLIETSS